MAEAVSQTLVTEFLQFYNAVCICIYTYIFIGLWFFLREPLVTSLHTGLLSHTILLLNFSWHVHLTPWQNMMKWHAYPEGHIAELDRTHHNSLLADLCSNWLPTCEDKIFNLFFPPPVFCYIKGTSCLKQLWPGSYSDCVVRISIKPNRCGPQRKLTKLGDRKVGRLHIPDQAISGLIVPQGMRISMYTKHLPPTAAIMLPRKKRSRQKLLQQQHIKDAEGLRHDANQHLQSLLSTYF